jgi:outer membrane protein TolC
MTALEPPMLSYAMAPRSIGAAVPFGQEIEISQPLPYPGRRRLTNDAAAAEVEVAAADLSLLVIELERRAAELYADLYLAHRAGDINAEHAALLEEFKQVATARYAAGLASQQDPLAAEAEVAHLQHDGLLLRSERAIVEARINALLHREPGAALPAPPSMLAPAASSAGSGDPDLAVLAERALAERPELRRADALVRARQAELDLAKFAGRPDLAVSTSYNSMWSDGEHRWMVGAAIGLPFWRQRVRAGAAEAEGRLAVARAERETLADEVRREVAEAAVRWHETHHVLELFPSRLLPVARDRVEAALAGFRTGQNDFLALVEAERALRDVTLDYHRALAGQERSRAALAAALGDTAATAAGAPPHAPGESR